MVKRISDLNSSQHVTRAIDGLDLQTHEQLAAAAQTASILDQLRLVLNSVDSDLRSLVKLTVYLRDMADFPFVRRVLIASLGDEPPAITAVAVHDLPFREARLQIEAVAV
jgi:2-iminobutanoate/2-iminopropanoate deaminase